jgi:hypothetical protein
MLHLSYKIQCLSILSLLATTPLMAMDGTEGVDLSKSVKPKLAAPAQQPQVVDSAAGEKPVKGPETVKQESSGGQEAVSTSLTAAAHQPVDVVLAVMGAGVKPVEGPETAKQGSSGSQEAAFASDTDDFVVIGPEFQSAVSERMRIYTSENPTYQPVNARYTSYGISRNYEYTCPEHGDHCYNMDCIEGLKFTNNSKITSTTNWSQVSADGLVAGEWAIRGGLVMLCPKISLTLSAVEILAAAGKYLEELEGRTFGGRLKQKTTEESDSKKNA